MDYRLRLLMERSQLPFIRIDGVTYSHTIYDSDLGIIDSMKHGLVLG